MSDVLDSQPLVSATECDRSTGFCGTRGFSLFPPAMQHRGRRVGFIFDPSGVPWHVTEVPS